MGLPWFSEQQKQVHFKRTVKVCINCSWQCFGTSSLSTTHLTVSLFLCSSGSNALGESRLQGGEEEVAGRNRRNKYYPNKGSSIYLNWKLNRKIDIQWFFTCGPPNIWLLVPSLALTTHLPCWFPAKFCGQTKTFSWEIAIFSMGDQFSWEECNMYVRLSDT